MCRMFHSNRSCPWQFPYRSESVFFLPHWQHVFTFFIYFEIIFFESLKSTESLLLTYFKSCLRVHYYSVACLPDTSLLLSPSLKSTFILSFAAAKQTELSMPSWGLFKLSNLQFNYHAKKDMTELDVQVVRIYIFHQRSNPFIYRIPS